MSSSTISENIAEIGCNLRYEDIPEAVMGNAKNFILDLIGCIVGAKNVDSSVAMIDTIVDLGGNPDSTVIGYGLKTSPAMAALANATMGHAFDMDDDHREGTQHSSVVVFPAILAAAERYRVDGKTLLTAFVYGSEVTIRLGEAFLGQTYFQGFHPTGTCGVFGSTAGVAKILGLDKKSSAYALGIAGSQAAGLLEWKAQGTWTKRFQAGHAAMGGVLSGMLAQKGYTGPTTILEGEDGFIRAYSYKDIWDLNKITGLFGKKWEMSDTSIKVHACCRFSAPLADCALDLYKQGVQAEDVEEILAKVNKYSIKVLCVPEEKKFSPQTVVDAQFSLPYAIAVGICKGRETIKEYTEEAIKDPDVLKLAAKVKWELDPEAEAVYPRYYPCTVIVKMKDGREYTSHVDYPKGDPENPVSLREVEEKFRFMAGTKLEKAKIEQIIETVLNLEKQENMDKLVSLLY